MNSKRQRNWGQSPIKNRDSPYFKSGTVPIFCDWYGDD
jgi:hypothetical protein